MKVFQVGIFLVQVILGGNFPGGSYPGWELSGGSYLGWEFSLVGVFWVGIVRGNDLGGSFPSTNIYLFFLVLLS